MAPRNYQLVVQTGPNPGQIFDLLEEEIAIGRDIANDIVINDPEVSRKHARLVVQSEGYLLEDTGSTNGTFVNGQRLIGPHLLRPGETVSLGERVSLSYESAGQDPDATQVSYPQVPQMPPAQRPEERRPPSAPAYEPEEPEFEWDEPEQPVYESPRPSRPAAPPPPPAYSGQVPPGPVEIYEEEEEPDRNRTLLYAGCGCLVVLLCVVVGAAIAFDQLNLYCTPPFNGFFNCP